MNRWDILTALTVVLISATNLLIQKYALSEMSVFVLTSLRLLLITPFIVLFWKARTKIFKYLMAGAFWCVLYYIALSLGLAENIGAGQSAFLLQTQIFSGVLFSYILLKEKPKSREILGLVVSSLGIMLLSFDKIGSNSLAGVAFLLISCVSWGFGLALLKILKIGGKIEDTVWLSGISAFPMLLICLYFEGPAQSLEAISQMNIDMWMSLFYIAFAANLVASFLWVRLTQKVSAATASPYMLLIPLISSLASSLITGETFNPLEILACAIILFGVILAQGFLAKIKLFWFPENQHTKSF